MNRGPASQTILVAGGGIAGITAAVEAAETGYEVLLIEREDQLGGWAGKELDRTCVNFVGYW